MAGLTEQSNPPGGIFGKAGSNKGKSASNEDASISHPNSACPKCGSKKAWRDGLRYQMFGNAIQRWLCRDCGLRFSDADDIQKAKETVETIESIESKLLKSKADIVAYSQICVTETKNLEAEQQIVKVPQKSEMNQNGAILDFLWHLKKENKAEGTIRSYRHSLNQLSKNGVNLFNPESFKETLALSSFSETHKYCLAKAYQSFLNYHKIDCKLPKYKCARRKDPYLPPTEHLAQLFNNFSQQMTCFCFTLKDTAARPVEALRIEWNDIDFANKKIAINHPAKGNNTRTIRVSDDLISMLQQLPRKGKLVFSYREYQYAEKGFRRMRQRAIAKTGNQELRKIHFYTCRYWRATDERHKKGNPDSVQYLLGHTSLNYVGLYARLSVDYFGNNQEFDVQEADDNDKPRIRMLLQKGYDPVLNINNGGVHYFRKAK
jgi:integrase